MFIEMDKTLFVWSLINIICCTIVTTGIVNDILTYSSLDHQFLDTHFERTAKAFCLFALLEFVSACVMVEMASWAVLPLIILLLAWFMSGFALYSNYKLSYDGNTCEHEDKMRKSNVVRGILWFGRFVSLFVFMVVYY